MGGNRFGTLFCVTTFGESHGPAVGCVVDGCPAGLALETEDIRRDLRRRRGGGGGAATERAEEDEPEILSGIFEGKTLGSPIAIVVRNTAARSTDYRELEDVYRNGHADWTWEAKYGFRDHRGGGRSSGRETLGRVAAGAVAKALLASYGIAIRAWTSAAAGIKAPGAGDEGFDFDEIERNLLRMPCRESAERALEKIEKLRAGGDSAGGIVSCMVTGMSAGLGEPVFAKLDALIAGAMLSIGAAKGVELGAGFASAAETGSAHNDRPAPPEAGEKARPGAAKTIHLPPGVPPLTYMSNNAGGTLGGISTGMPLEFRVAFKPVPSIALKQEAADRQGKIREIAIKGRHDACIVPRAVPVVEAMAALVLADLLLLHRAARE